MKTREDEIREAAKAFHDENPIVWDLFCRFTFHVINRGFANYGARQIFGRIRWETDQPDTEGKPTFKVDNNHSAHYARWFMEEYPEHEGFFRTRVLKSAFELATDMPPLTPDDFPYNNQDGV